MRRLGTSSPGFRHEMLRYAGDEGFVVRTAAFVGSAVAAQEPVLVVVDGAKLEPLQRALGSAAPGVRFEDMDSVGRNPARIIPAWREFVDEHAGSGHSLRGVGEPISSRRTPEALAECERHEALLNLALADAPLWLACPYDVSALPPAVVQEAERNHPVVSDGLAARPSDAFAGIGEISRPFDLPLDALEGLPCLEVSFDATSIPAARDAVRSSATALGLGAAKTDDLVLAVSEVTTNSVLYGGGSGSLSLWALDPIVCEVRDSGGTVMDPLVGRVRPRGDRPGGFGVWLANQLCDLVQIRTFPTGSVVRLHIAR